VTAVKALARGDASEAQQKNVFRWIVEGASVYYGMSYRGGFGGDRDTAFLEGRRFVGHQLVHLVNMTREQMETLRSNENGRNTEQP
jgi:hypothetical protein